MPLPDVALGFDAVSLVREGKNLLREITWTVEVDERWVILGPNGAGKTTLLNVAAGRDHPSAGSVVVLGEPIGRTDLLELSTRVGFTSVAVHDRLPADEPVRDVVVTAGWAIVGRFREGYDPTDMSRADALLAQFGLTELADRRYGSLSEGERKRAQIARALMTDPELLLLDEPAAGLDLGGREDLLRRLTGLAENPDAPTTVLVTHHVEEIPAGFTHGLLLREGSIVAQGWLPDVITSEHLSATFDLALDVYLDGGRYTARIKD